MGVNCHNPLFFQAGLKVTCSMEGGRAWGSSYSMTNLASVLYTMSCTYTVYTSLGVTCSYMYMYMYM